MSLTDANDKSVLSDAIACSNGDKAAALIMQALGITDDAIANYSLPREWPTDRGMRCRALAEWLSNECVYRI